MLFAPSTDVPVVLGCITVYFLILPSQSCYFSLTVSFPVAGWTNRNKKNLRTKRTIKNIYQK